MTLAQIGAILALLVAFGVDPQTVITIQGILEPAPIVQMATPNPVPLITPQILFGNTQPTCIEHPQLTITGQRQSSPPDMVSVHAVYTTGCKLDQTTKYAFKFIDASTTRTIEEDSRMLSQDPYPDTEKWEFTFGQIFHQPNINIIFTVGDTTATTTVI